MILNYLDKQLKVSRVSKFIATRQRGVVSVIGRAMGRTAKHGLVPVRTVKIQLPKYYELEFFKSDKHRLVIVVNGLPVWYDDPRSGKEGDSKHECGPCSQKSDSVTEKGAICAAPSDSRSFEGT